MPAGRLRTAALAVPHERVLIVDKSIKAAKHIFPDSFIFSLVPRRNGQNRVLRGGSWINSAWNCRLSNRNNNDPENRSNNNGFRLVLAPARVCFWMEAFPNSRTAPVPFAKADKKRYSYRPRVSVLVGTTFRRFWHPFRFYTH